ncbi:MAG: GAF domain-containing sensor histidine kinase [Rhodothermaceae bacterium]|nr:GAF domain-containing sensor histidine kinase [Rhodothermaceae bacterium]
MFTEDISKQELKTQLSAEKKKLALVKEVGRALSSAMDLDSLLTLIMENITQLMEADRSTLYLRTDDGETLWSRMAQGDGHIEIELKVGEGLAGWVVSSGELVNIPDAYTDDRFQPAIDQQTGYKTTSILCLPMRNHGRDIIGAVQVLNKKGGPFEKEDESLLEALAGQAAIAIENTKLYQSVVAKNAALNITQIELKQRGFELNVLYDIEREMNGAHDLDELLERILKRAIKIVGATAGSIALRSKRLGDLRFHTTAGDHGDQVRRHRIPLGKGIIGWVAAQGEAALVNLPEGDDRHATDFANLIGVQPRHILCCPLILGQEVLGAIELMDKIDPVTKDTTKGFDEDDLKLLQLIAGQTSRAVQLARANIERENENRLATIGQMMAGVLHDLKTPMTIVQWYGDMMAESQDEHERQKFTKLIKRQFELMDGMTREVLAFARGESRLLIRKVHISRFLKEIVDQLEHELAGQNINIHLEVNKPDVVYFDENKIMRLIHNLARNAAQAMQDGGNVTIASSQDKDLLRLEFKDDGPGIPTELQGRLFDPFTTAGKKGGTGLGLAIVKKIVEEHQGEIVCTSSPENGTVFEVTLPLNIYKAGQ